MSAGGHQVLRLVFIDLEPHAASRVIQLSYHFNDIRWTSAHGVQIIGISKNLLGFVKNIVNWKLLRDITVYVVSCYGSFNSDSEKTYDLLGNSRAG